MGKTAKIGHILDCILTTCAGISNILQLTISLP